MSKNLLDEIDAFLAERKIGDHRFGVLAINNGRLMERLRSGGRIWPETEDRIRQFIELERKALCATDERYKAHPNTRVISTNSPATPPAGEAGAQCSAISCAPASFSGEAAE